MSANYLFPDIISRENAFSSKRWGGAQLLNYLNSEVFQKEIINSGGSQLDLL